MTLRDYASIGSTLLVTLALVCGASLSGRLYQENRQTQKVLAAGVVSGELACLQPHAELIP